jgi:hypothetical protein
MEKHEVLGPNGRITIIENDFFKIEGHEIQIANITFDPKELKYEGKGFNGLKYTLPPHIMEQLGEALILMAHLNFERIQETAKREAARIRREEKKTRKDL